MCSVELVTAMNERSEMLAEILAGKSFLVFGRLAKFRIEYQDGLPGVGVPGFSMLPGEPTEGVALKEFIVVEQDGAERKFWITNYTATSSGALDLWRGGETVGVVLPPYRSAFYADVTVQPPADQEEAAA